MKNEIILTCDCMCLDHIFLFIYFPPEREQDYQDNTVFMKMRSVNLYSRIMPPLHYIGWGDYFRFHYFKRLIVVLKYLFKLSFEKDFSIFDSFNFRVRDLNKIDNFLLEYKTKNNDTTEKITHKRDIEKEDYKNRYKINIFITPTEIEEGLTIGYKFKFCDGNIWKRIKTSFNYLFYSKYSEEQEFEIESIDDISIFRSMIEDVFISNLGISDIIENISNDMIENIEEE